MASDPIRSVEGRAGSDASLAHPWLGTVRGWRNASASPGVSEPRDRAWPCPAVTFGGMSFLLRNDVSCVRYIRRAQRGTPPPPAGLAALGAHACLEHATVGVPGHCAAFVQCYAPLCAAEILHCTQFGGLFRGTRSQNTPPTAPPPSPPPPPRLATRQAPSLSSQRFPGKSVAYTERPDRVTECGTRRNSRLGCRGPRRPACCRPGTAPRGNSAVPDVPPGSPARRPEARPPHLPVTRGNLSPRPPRSPGTEVRRSFLSVFFSPHADSASVELDQCSRSVFCNCVRRQTVKFVT